MLLMALSSLSFGNLVSPDLCCWAAGGAHKGLHRGLGEGVLGVKRRGWTQLSGPRTQRPREARSGLGAVRAGHLALVFRGGGASLSLQGWGWGMEGVCAAAQQQHQQEPARARLAHLAPRQGEPHCPTQLPVANPREAPTGP